MPLDPFVEYKQLKFRCCMVTFYKQGPDRDLPKNMRQKSGKVPPSLEALLENKACRLDFQIGS